MAAAEYYSSAPMGPTQQPSPYQQPQYNQAPLSNHQYPSPQSYTSEHPPPPYQAVQHETRPSVHFADQSQRPPRNSFSSQAPIPVVSDQHHRPSLSNHSYSSQSKPAPPQAYSPNLKPAIPPSSGGYPPQTHQRQHSQSAAPASNPQYLSPYSHLNQSQYSVSGYSSDPERHRRRRRRHSNDTREVHHGDHERERRADGARGHRSRSTNTDGFLGAAGGGLIGDMIFPGLGTLGGAVAGWIGGKDYGKHRKHREERLDKDQDRWEHRHRRHSNDRDLSPRGRESRSYQRHT